MLPWHNPAASIFYGRGIRFQAKAHRRSFAWKCRNRSIVILHEGIEVEHIAQQLRREGKEVVVWALPEKKDICWFTAKPKKELLNSLQSRHYDLLIDLTQQTGITMQYMAMHVKAGFKTGREIGKKLYDLSISTPAQSTPDFLYQQIVKYIQMFTQG